MRRSDMHVPVISCAHLCISIIILFLHNCVKNINIFLIDPAPVSYSLAISLFLNYIFTIVEIQVYDNLLDNK